MRTRTMYAALAAGALLLTGCGSDGGTSGGGASADVEAAETYLEPWNGEGEKSLLIDEPLSKPIAAGTKVVYLDVGTPVSAVMWGNLQAPAKLLGLELERVEVGRDAQSINAAMNTVVEKNPDGVINITLDPVFFEAQIKALEDKGVPIASGSVMNTVEHDLPEAFNGPDWMKANGAALAAAAVVRSEGASEYVFYNVPEFPFSPLELEGAKAKMKELCPDCTLRTVDIPIAELGSTAADRVVSDLQANPDTDYFIAAVDEVQIGLPQKLKLAGIETNGIGMWTSPPNYEQIGTGDQDATLSVDLNLMMWTVLDQLLRELNGDAYEWPSTEVRASTLTRVTDAGSVPDDATVGYQAIEDLEALFAKSWLVD